MKKTITVFAALLMFVGGFPASAASLSLITSPATAVTSSGATLNGLYTATGAPAQVWFQYGTSPTTLTEYSSIQTKPVGSGLYAAGITGLQPATTYYFKAFGSQGGTPSTAIATQTFTTPAAVQTINTITFPATNVGESVATLQGNINNTSGTAATRYFKWGTSAISPNNMITVPGTTTTSGQFSAVISGLSPNTTYYYKAYVSNNLGTVPASQTMSFTTQGTPLQTMTVITYPATSVATSSAVLNAYANVNGTTAITRYFKWGTSSTSLTQTLSVSGSQTVNGTFSATLSGLSPNTTYYFRAFGVNSLGTVQANQTQLFTTQTAPITFVCNDGNDNDHDGLTDYPSDPGCSSPNDPDEYNIPPTTYACSDNADNDNDGLTDYPNDPGCTSAHDNNESNTQTQTYACNDGFDNDSDGLTDYPQDPGCTFATDPSEVNVTNTGIAPTVVTQPALNVYQTGATLVGFLSANNSPSYYWFEYGPNGSLGTTTSQVSFGSGTGTVNQAIGNLQPSTSYSFRMCASNANGQNCGNTLTFTTIQGHCTYNCGNTGTAPIVSTSSAGNVTTNSAVMYGYVDPGNSNNGNTSALVLFKYGPNGNLSYTAYTNPNTISAAQTVNAFASNLTPNTVYSFQVCASNQYGQNCGNILSFTTTNAYVQPPIYQPCPNGCPPVYPPVYPPVEPPTRQPPIIIYTYDDNGNDYVVGSSTLATLRLTAMQRDVARDDLVSYTVTLTNESNRKLKNIEMHVTAPIDLSLSSTSEGEISFAINTVTAKFATLAAGASKSFTVTARVSNNTKAKSFVVHADASYLNTLSGERETVTAEIMTSLGGNNMLASVFGSGFGGGLIWFLVGLLILLLIFLLTTRPRREEVREVPLPPSRWPTA